MYICGRGKDQYLTRKKKELEKNDPRYRQWFSENNMVMSWLVNSMEKNGGHSFIYYTTAQEIWRVAKATFSDRENTLELFEIKNMFRHLKQGDFDVTQYFNVLSYYWQQMDTFEDLGWACPNCICDFKEFVEK